jgi:gamma-glutamyltranspeptidase/glutathione hydrolase
MVAAAHPLAVDAGLEVLRRGGSAVDAAIAVQMVLGVVEPQASGIGGGGFLLHYDAGTKADYAVYDGRETAPAGANPSMFLDRPTASRSAFARPWPPASRWAFPDCWRCWSSRTRNAASSPGLSCSRRRSPPARNGFAIPPRLAGLARSAFRRCAKSRRSARPTSTSTERHAGRASASPIPLLPRPWN